MQFNHVTSARILLLLMHGYVMEYIVFWYFSKRLMACVIRIPGNNSKPKTIHT